MVKYSRLYSIDVDRGCSLVQAGSWNNGRWEWKLGWRRILFMWEENEVAQLLFLVDNKKVVEEGESGVESWSWRVIFL